MKNILDFIENFIHTQTNIKEMSAKEITLNIKS